ncbi:hypothetical protein BH10CYA1_BH10CYA1_59300 [soil metagenome]
MALSMPSADGFDNVMLDAIVEALINEGAVPRVVVPHRGFIKGQDGRELKVDFALLTTRSVLLEALYVAGGEADSKALKADAATILFVNTVP